MNNKIIIFSLIIFLNHLGINLTAQSIYDKAATQANSERALYNKYNLATSNAYGYLHKDYTPKAYKKIVFFVNTEDHKTIKFIQQTFHNSSIQAFNFYDLDCTQCNDAEQVKKFLKEKDIECVLQITLTSEIERGMSMTTSYFSQYGVAVSLGTMSGWSDVWAVFEWYDSDFEEIPFLRSQAKKSSSRPRYYPLMNGVIELSIKRPMKEGLILKPGY